MNIAVIGSGSVGAALGRRWAEIGHNVTFGVRDKTAPKITKLLYDISTPTYANDISTAVKNADIIALAVPFHAVEEIVNQCDSFVGKIIIDCTNPRLGKDTVSLGLENSAGETIAKLIPDAPVIKAFNCTGSNTMENPIYNKQPSTMFICGNDPNAKKVVSQLSDELGFETVDAGDITISRYLEPMAALWVALAYDQRMGREISFMLLKR